jgi:PST family polysaccharide transporter
MWSGLLTMFVGLATRGIIVRDFGLDANGIYQAAWGLSGLFAGFILGAMGTDFYPRLTAVSNDRLAMIRLVNEQTEIGILLALPGLVGTLIFAPWVIHLFYTAKFLQSAELLPWFVLGVFVTVISWPQGFIMLALGSGKWFATTETISLGIQMGLTVFLLKALGLWGVALAYFLMHLISNFMVLAVSTHLIRFRWSVKVVRMLLETTLLIAVAFLLRHLLPEWATLSVGAILTAGAGIYTLRGLAARIGPEHRLVLLACRFPGGRIICGI